MLAKTDLDEYHDILLRAAEWIEKHGWWDGKRPRTRHVDGITQFPPACVTQAIAWVDESYTGLKARKILADYLGIDDNMITTWNDNQSAEVVIETLRNAAYGIK